MGSWVWGPVSPLLVCCVPRDHPEKTGCYVETCAVAAALAAAAVSAAPSAVAVGTPETAAWVFLLLPPLLLPAPVQQRQPLGRGCQLQQLLQKDSSPALHSSLLQATLVLG